MRDRTFSRRQIFGAFGAAALAACNGDKPQRGLLGAMEKWNRGVQGTLFRPGLSVSGDDVTPEDDFPVYHASVTGVPLPPPGWKLEVGGMCERPRAFTLEELMAMPSTTARIEHHCVEGWSATADWTGVRLRDLADIVGARKVGYVDFRSFDAGYWTSWDRDSAFHPQTLIAWGMNGKPLGAPHGGPVRLYGSVKLGYKQIKYLTSVSFLDHETGGYWESAGYEWYAGT